MVSVFDVAAFILHEKGSITAMKLNPTRNAFQKQVEPKKQAKKLQEFTERKAHYPVWQFSSYLG